MPARDATRTAALLRARRTTGGYTVTGLAERLREVAPERIRRELPKLRDLERTIRGHEAAAHSVGPRYRLLYALAYGTTEDELFADPESGSPNAGSVQETEPPHDWDEMERRLLLLAAIGMSAGAFASSGESVSRLLGLALNSEARSVEDWELACDDHLHALRTRPPSQVRNDLMVDLFALQRQLRTADDDNADLQRVAAALSTLHAAVLTRLGEHGAAIQWWRAAKAAADASGDHELRLGVRATEAGHGLYGQRDAETVLRLTQKAQQIGGQAPSTWLALVACSQAKALAFLGRRADARRVLDTYRDLAASAPAPKGVMPGYWNNGHLHYAENMVYAGVGDERQAHRASDLVLASSNPDYQVSLQVRLHNALCTTVNGGIEEGARRAASVLDALPASYRSHMITETGRMILHAVPREKRERTALREFAEVLTKTAPTPHTLPAA